MPLINFQTDLTNLPWGKDRRDGGSSNQPYITKSIPGGDDLPLRTGPDFIIRGGSKSITNSVEDVSRLTQMFTDDTSLKGLLFTAKQNILSRNSVKTQTSSGVGYAGVGKVKFKNKNNGVIMRGGGPLNQGVYTPLSTLGQAAGGFAGLHLNQLGVIPISDIFGGLKTYDSVVGLEKINNDNESNRLVNLKYFIDEDGNSSFNKTNILSYSGGPGSVLGIGRTNIKFSKESRTGIANRNGIGIQSGRYQNGVKNRSYSEEIKSSFKYDNRGTKGTPNATSQFANNNSLSFGDQTRLFYLNGAEAIRTGSNGIEQNFVFSTTRIPEDDRSPITVNPGIFYQNNSVTFTPGQIVNKENIVDGGQSSLYPKDFRKELYTYPDTGSAPTDNTKNPLQGGTQKSSVLSLSPSYRAKNADVRFNMGQPGRQGGQLRGDSQANGLNKNVWNYGINATELEALDKITAMPMYSSTGPDVSQPINDAIKFRIAAINNDNTNGEAVYMHFRAFLDDFSDSYTATWNSVNYVGRGDTLYNYGGFGRTISLGFTVAAQSKAELIPMYKKLNYLASTLAPDYSAAGFMRGNMVRLTLGGYLYEQPGFITGLTYTVPQESPWEIAINAEGGSDGSVKELPHIIKVSGFSFTPIHTFLPEKPNDANFATDGKGNRSSRFIALSNGVNSNYNDEYRTYEPNSTTDGDNNSLTA